jgi:hypothetical protein
VETENLFSPLVFQALEGGNFSCGLASSLVCFLLLFDHHRVKFGDFALEANECGVLRW